MLRQAPGEHARQTTLLQKGRVLAGDYGSWWVAAEHHGAEIWVVAEPPRWRRFRNARGQVAEGLAYRRADGLVARAEYVELMPEFRLAPAVIPCARAGASRRGHSPAPPGYRART